MNFSIIAIKVMAFWRVIIFTNARQVSARVLLRAARTKSWNCSFTMMLCINRYDNYTRAYSSSFQISGEVLKRYNN